MLAMDLIKTIAEETMRFCVGLYGLCVLFSVYYVISFGIERLVKWIANRITANRKADSVCK
jgi:hypothetical protein